MFRNTIIVVILAIAVAGLITFGTPQQTTHADNPPEKLVQGVSNAVFGAPVELIKQPIIGAKESSGSAIIGGVVGFFKGIGIATKRVGGGALDAITFWDGNENLVKTYPW